MNSSIEETVDYWLAFAPNLQLANRLQNRAERQRIIPLRGDPLGRFVVDGGDQLHPRIAVLGSRFSGNISRYAGAFAELATAIEREANGGRCRIVSDTHLRPIVTHIANTGPKPEKNELVRPCVCSTPAVFWRRLNRLNGRQLLVSPPLSTQGKSFQTEDSVPIPILVALAWADVVIVPWIREGSQLSRYLLSTQRSTLHGESGPEIVICSPFFPAGMEESLRAADIRMLPTTRLAPSEENLDDASGSRERWPTPSIVRDRTEGLIRGRQGLIHCVRGTAGSRLIDLNPAQLSRLVSGQSLELQSPTDVLQQIVGERRIAASSKMIRGEYRVTCFTGNSFDRLPDISCYRRGRCRWDFSPYGIWLASDWLVELGARPVQYGDETLWNELPPSDRPWFQLCHANSVDWSVEAEWRIHGDVPLHDAPPNAAFLFVPTPHDVQRLQAQSPWPVVCLFPEVAEFGASD